MPHAKLAPAASSLPAAHQRHAGGVTGSGWSRSSELSKNRSGLQDRPQQQAEIAVTPRAVVGSETEQVHPPLAHRCGGPGGGTCDHLRVLGPA